MWLARILLQWHSVFTHFTSELFSKSPLLSLFYGISFFFSVPSRSPINVTAFKTSSTSINVTWEPVPDDHVNGIVLGYRLFYKQADKAINDFSNLTVNSSIFDIEINGLKFYTKYELRLLAFTMVGDGNISEPVYCMTDEDGKLLLH